MSVNTAIFDGNNSGRAAYVDSQNRLATGDPWAVGEISDQTTTPIYFGFEKEDGSWKIQRQSAANPSSWRYASGDSDFPTAWTNRASQVYNYYSDEY
jgi:hypothetical protein